MLGKIIFKGLFTVSLGTCTENAVQSNHSILKYSVISGWSRECSPDALQMQVNE